VSLASLLPYAYAHYCHFDEMMLLAEAKRVYFGEQQHRDFFSFYGGGNFYLIALLWRLLGEIAYEPVRLLNFGGVILGGVLLLLTARYFTARFWLALLPTIIYVNYLAQI